MNNFKEFMDHYLGMIIGILVVAFAIIFGWVYVFECIALLIGGAWLGKYVQNNKESVKEKIKNLVDKF